MLYVLPAWEPFSLLDFAPVGLVALGVGVLYMVFIGYRLLPDRTPAERFAEAAGPDADLVDLYAWANGYFGRACLPLRP